MEKQGPFSLHPALPPVKTMLHGLWFGVRVHPSLPSYLHPPGPGGVHYRLPQIGISVPWAAMGLISGRWPTAVVALAYQLPHRPCLSPGGEAAGEAQGLLSPGPPKPVMGL